MRMKQNEDFRYVAFRLLLPMRVRFGNFGGWLTGTVNNRMTKHLNESVCEKWQLCLARRVADFDLRDSTLFGESAVEIEGREHFLLTAVAAIARKEAIARRTNQCLQER